MMLRFARLVPAGALLLALALLPGVAAAQAAAPKPARTAKAATRFASFEHKLTVGQLRPAAPPPVVVTGTGNLIVGLEVRETVPGMPTKIERFALPLTEHGHANIDSRIGDTEYRIGVHLDGPDQSAPIEFAVEKNLRGPGTRSEARVKAAVRIRPRQRVVIARMDRSDGSRTEVIAELK